MQNRIVEQSDNFNSCLKKIKKAVKSGWFWIGLIPIKPVPVYERGDDGRKQTHENFMIGVRMGEYLPSSQDGIEIAQIFEKAGIDLLHISFAANPPTHAVPPDFICSPTTYSGCKIKQEVTVPVIAVNEIRTEEQVRFLIENDYVDFAGIGRAMFADPAFANHVIHSEPVNQCFGCGNNEGCFWLTDHLLCPARKQTT